MFLASLTDENQKMLFLHLARTVTIAEGDLTGLEESLDWTSIAENSQESFSGKLLQALTSDQEKLKFNALVMELGSEMIFQGSSRWRATIPYPKPDNYFIENYDEHTFLKAFTKAVTGGIDSTKADPNNKKKVMTKLLDNGIDLGEINQTLIHFTFALLPEVRKEIMSILVHEAFDEHKTAAENLTLAQRKAIMLELAAVGNLGGRVDDLERKVLEAIREKLEVDPVFLEEAEVVVRKINEAALEALELIAE